VGLGAQVLEFIEVGVAFEYARHLLLVLLVLLSLVFVSSSQPDNIEPWTYSNQLLIHRENRYIMVQSGFFSMSLGTFWTNHFEF